VSPARRPVLGSSGRPPAAGPGPRRSAANRLRPAADPTRPAGVRTQRSGPRCGPPTPTRPPRPWCSRAAHVDPAAPGPRRQPVHVRRPRVLRPRRRRHRIAVVVLTLHRRHRNAADVPVVGRQEDRITGTYARRRLPLLKVSPSIQNRSPDAASHDRVRGAPGQAPRCRPCRCGGSRPWSTAGPRRRRRRTGISGVRRR
jgi:hypothetical protein